MTISVAVMAVKQRAHFVEDLLGRLDIGADRVVWDRHQDRCDTGLRVMRHYDPAASHHLVIQDDALVCNDLLAGIEELVQHTGDHPVSLYVGKVRPHPQHVQERFNAARKVDSPLLKMRGPLWGVGIVFPTAHLDALCDWFPTHSHPNYDMRVSRWYMNEAKLDCLYTVPSLVDHRPVTENPSMVEGRTGNRQAHGFIGEDASALDIDWGNLQQGDGMATFRNIRSPHLDPVTVPDGSKSFERLTNLSAIWERIDEPLVTAERKPPHPPPATPPEGDAESNPPHEPVDPPDVDELHTGSGWYTLPDGTKVRGRTAALEAIA